MQAIQKLFVLTGVCYFDEEIANEVLVGMGLQDKDISYFSEARQRAACQRRRAA